MSHNGLSIKIIWIKIQLITLIYYLKMKQQQLILKPCEHFGGYNYLKFLFAEDATDNIQNFDLLIEYLITIYNRKDIDKKGKTIAVMVSSVKDEVLFIDDNRACEYYLFPINRSDAIERLNQLSDYIEEIKEDLELSMHFKIKTSYDDENNMDDSITITINDAPIPRYKKALRIIMVVFPSISFRGIPNHSIFRDDPRKF